MCVFFGVFSVTLSCMWVAGPLTPPRWLGAGSSPWPWLPWAGPRSVYSAAAASALRAHQWPQEFKMHFRALCHRGFHHCDIKLEVLLVPPWFPSL